MRMRMASRRDAVAPMVDRILEAVAPAGLDEDRLTDLAVALAEALSNAAVHGHGLDPKRRVAIVLSVRPRCVVVEVSDSGSGFDAGGVSDPDVPGAAARAGRTRDLPDAPAGGRGLVQPLRQRRPPHRAAAREPRRRRELRRRVASPPTSP